MIEEKIILDLLVSAAWIVPIVTGIVQVIKGLNYISEKFLPLVSIVVGISMGLLAIEVSVLGALVGLVFGLSASGFYDLGKKTLKG